MKVERGRQWEWEAVLAAAPLARVEFLTASTRATCCENGGCRALNQHGHYGGGTSCRQILLHSSSSSSKRFSISFVVL
jgi:hypothetical protein